MLYTLHAGIAGAHVLHAKVLLQPNNYFTHVLPHGSSFQSPTLRIVHLDRRYRNRLDFARTAQTTSGGRSVRLNCEEATQC
jgi:hypothetical protein